MRRKVIAGNWKMFNDINESQNLISKLISGLNSETLKNEIIICPPFTSLSEAHKLIQNSVIKLGAQNLYFEDSGAFTGEVSARMLKSVGCEYVIIGHSERRTIFKEDDDLINKKIKKALSAGLKPIFCIGETLEERESGVTKNVVEKQLNLGLNSITEDNLERIIIAYEPVWAIGTGKTATPEQAQEVHEFIRSVIESKYSAQAAKVLIIQYGGSVKPDNAAALLSQKDIDGALVGGACLKAESFIQIIMAA
ncbi:MAG: triose-phosphate isomerase [Ignavibacteriaceae bacterium]|nr:triose-phosphate isomerase [Ignavibacteriaceae bacterium]